MRRTNKSFVELVIVLVFTSVSSLGQPTYSPTTIYTPLGTLVEALIFERPDLYDLSQTEKDDWRNHWLDYYENRIKFDAEATRTYNCHAFAWWMSEGGSTVWVDAPEEEKYWEDSSYIEVSSQFSATKVFYGQGPGNDHSAITTPIEGRFISKWAYWPRFVHDANDCPWSIGMNLHYYVLRPKITGLDVVCPSSGTAFTLNNPPTNFSVVWSTSPEPQGSDYSVVPNGNECIITNYDHVGEIVLTATLTNDYDTIVASKVVFLTYSPNYYTLYASITTGGNTDWLQNCNGLFTYTFPGMYSGEIQIWDPVYVPFINNVTWTNISQTGCTSAGIGTSSDGKEVFLNLKPFGCTATFRMTATNDCGSFYYDYSFVAGENCYIEKSVPGKIPSQIFTYPNPTRGVFTVKYISEDSDSGIEEIVLRSSIGVELMRKKYNGQETIVLDISQQMSGIYYLEVFDGKTMTTHTISVQK